MRRLLVALPLLLLAAACTDGGDPDSDATPDAATSNGPLPVVDVTVGSAGTVKAEVADSDEERALGLMARKAVPLGTGMVFRYDAPVDAKFYMYRVPVQLTAVFAREGKVVGVTLMAPCPFAKRRGLPDLRPGPALRHRAGDRAGHGGRQGQGGGPAGVAGGQ